METIEMVGLPEMMSVMQSEELALMECGLSGEEIQSEYAKGLPMSKVFNNIVS
jgi:hypothetical protein